MQIHHAIFFSDLASSFTFSYSYNMFCNYQNGGAILVGCHGSPFGYETSGLPHFLENQLTVGGEVLSLSAGSALIPRKISGSNFWQKQRPYKTIVQLEELRK
jgi:hypothetical protein